MLTTARLRLRVPEPADVDALFALYADERVWRADPVSRQTRPDETAAMVERWRAGHDRDGTGMWVAETPSDELVGVGGCFVRHGVAWNLGFRLVPEHWGKGLAQELAVAAAADARARRRDLAVTAYALEGNDRSLRVCERLGLDVVWRGPDAGNPDPSAVRVVLADRDLPPEVLAPLTA